MAARAQPIEASLVDDQTDGDDSATHTLTHRHKGPYTYAHVIYPDYLIEDHPFHSFIVAQ